jgi:hypothetical protein
MLKRRRNPSCDTEHARLFVAIPRVVSARTQNQLCVSHYLSMIYRHDFGCSVASNATRPNE